MTDVEMGQPSNPRNMYSKKPQEPQGDYSLGSTHFPGLSKVVEEGGEVLEVLGKIIASGGKVRYEHIRVRVPVDSVPLPGDDASPSDKQRMSVAPTVPREVAVLKHYDGYRNLLECLVEEIADLNAAVDAFLVLNKEMLDKVHPHKSLNKWFAELTNAKYQMLMDWHNHHYPASKSAEMQAKLDQEALASIMGENLDNVVAPEPCD